MTSSPRAPGRNQPLIVHLLYCAAIIAASWLVAAALGAVADPGNQVWRIATMPMCGSAVQPPAVQPS